MSDTKGSETEQVSSITEKKEGFLLDTEALKRRLLTEIVERGRIPVEKLQHDIPDDIFKEVMMDIVGKGLCYVEQGIVVIGEENNKKVLSKLPIIWDTDLKSIKTEQVNWYVKGYIPEKAVILWAGKRASFKSWSGLHLAVSLASGKPLFNKFETSKVSVLYIDEENGIETLKDRISKIKNGMGIKEDLENLGYVSFESIKIDRYEDRDKIRNFLAEHNPCVIIVDSFRRVISTEENDATEMNKVFTELIRPITQEFNCSWVLIHHLRKGIGGKVSEDILDELRGSSEITNYADIVIIFVRPAKVQNRFILREAKCRRAREQPPYIIEMKWDEALNSLQFDTIGTAEEILDSIDICAKKVMVWLEESNIVSFETKQIKETMKKDGFSKATIDRSVSLLVNQGKIVRVKRGSYSRVKETLDNYETKHQ